MQFRLRSLLIVLAVGPPLLAVAWFVRLALREYWAEQAARQPPVPQLKAGLTAEEQGFLD